VRCWMGDKNAGDGGLPKIRVLWRGGVERGATLASFSPMYDSFPTSGSGSPVDGVYDQRTPIKAPHS
jgi:hypothetical protein